MFTSAPTAEELKPTPKEQALAIGLIEWMKHSISEIAHKNYEK
jgi:hypothetical protein